MSSGIICRTKKNVAPGKNDKICFQNGNLLNGSGTKKNKSVNYNIEMKSKNEARKFLPAMLKDKDLKISYKKENPKKPGTKAYERYEGYKKATTLKKARELGAVREDFIFDGDRGYMKVVEEAKPPKRLVELKKKNPSKSRERGSTPERARTPTRTPPRRRVRTPVREGVPQGIRLPATESASMNINRLALATTGAVQQDAVSTLSALNSIFTQPL